MPFLQFKIRRRTREKIFRAKAVLSLAIWLTMTAAEICPPVHAWLHGGTVPKDDGSYKLNDRRCLPAGINFLAGEFKNVAAAIKKPPRFPGAA